MFLFFSPGVVDYLLIIAGGFRVVERSRHWVYGSSGVVQSFIGDTIIPIKDCWYKGEHPKL